MKHDIIKDPSTENVLKMFFECKKGFISSATGIEEKITQT